MEYYQYDFKLPRMPSWEISIFWFRTCMILSHEFVTKLKCKNVNRKHTNSTIHVW